MLVFQGKKKGRQGEGSGDRERGKGKKGIREERRRRGRERGKEGRREGRRVQGREAGGTRGTKFGYRHHFCTNIRLPPGDRTRIPTKLPPIPKSHFCHATLFQIPCDAVGLRPVGASLRKSFPTRYECFCRCLLTYQQLEHCLTQFLNHSRHYLIDKGVPLSTAACSQFCVTHNQTLFPFPVTSTFLARPLEGNSFSTQDKLKSWDRTIPQGSAPPHSPIHSHLPGGKCSSSSHELLFRPHWHWPQCSCNSSPAPCDSGKQIGRTRHLVSVDVHTWTSGAGTISPSPSSVPSLRTYTHSYAPTLTVSICLFWL